MPILTVFDSPRYRSDIAKGRARIGIGGALTFVCHSIQDSYLRSWRVLGQIYLYGALKLPREQGPRRSHGHAPVTLSSLRRLYVASRLKVLSRLRNAKSARLMSKDLAAALNPPCPTTELCMNFRLVSSIACTAAYHLREIPFYFSGSLRDSTTTTFLEESSFWYGRGNRKSFGRRLI